MTTPTYRLVRRARVRADAPPAPQGQARGPPAPRRCCGRRRTITELGAGRCVCRSSALEHGGRVCPAGARRPQRAQGDEVCGRCRPAAAPGPGMGPEGQAAVDGPRRGRERVQGAEGRGREARRRRRGREEEEQEGAWVCPLDALGEVDGGVGLGRTSTRWRLPCGTRTRRTTRCGRTTTTSSRCGSAGSGRSGGSGSSRSVGGARTGSGSGGAAATRTATTVRPRTSVPARPVSLGELVLLV